MASIGLFELLILCLLGLPVLGGLAGIVVLVVLLRSKKPKG